MKIIKTYVLEKPLDKDVAGFIRDAKAGCYQWDQKYGGEGLKMIRHYFKFIQKEFDQENYALARTVYKKLIFMLCDTSKFDYFNYTDIIDIGRLNFEKITGNYFTCLIKLCTVKELFEEYCEYVKAKEEYYFEAADKTIVDQLDKKSFRTFERMVYKKAKTLTKKDYYEMDLIYFLLYLARRGKDREKWNELCDEFGDCIGDPEEQKELFDEEG